jgi:hypothetical protein
MDILSLRVNPDWYFETCAVDLLRALLAIARRSEAQRSATAFFTPSSEAERAAIRTAYEIAGFQVERTGSLLYRTTLSALEGVTWIRERSRSVGETEQLMALSQADRYERKALEAFLLGRDGVYMDLPLENADVIPEISMLSLDAEGRISGALLFTGEEEGLTLAALALNGREAIRSAVPMLSEALRTAMVLFSAQTVLHIGAITESSRALVNKLARDTRMEVREGYRAEWIREMPKPDHRTAGQWAFDILEM